MLKTCPAAKFGTSFLSMGKWNALPSETFAWRYDWSLYSNVLITSMFSVNGTSQ